MVLVQHDDVIGYLVIIAITISVRCGCEKQPEAVDFLYVFGSKIVIYPVNNAPATHYF